MVVRELTVVGRLPYAAVDLWATPAGERDRLPPAQLIRLDTTVRVRARERERERVGAERAVHLLFRAGFLDDPRRDASLPATRGARRPAATAVAGGRRPQGRPRRAGPPSALTASACIRHAVDYDESWNPRR